MLELYDQKLESGLIVSRFYGNRKSLPADGADLREALHRQEQLAQVRDYLKLGREHPGLRMSVPGNAYVVSTGTAAIALTAAAAKTVMYINAAAANQPSIVEFSISFDGVTATNTPALIEFVFGTKASNSTPGTGSTTFTPLQLRGWPAQASANAAANNCSSEPTVLTAVKQWLLTPNGGLLVIQMPLGREITAVASGTAVSGNQVGIRVTAPQIVNTRGYIEYEE
jgi:hypothetical protein